MCNPFGIGQRVRVVALLDRDGRPPHPRLLPLLGRVGVVVRPHEPGEITVEMGPGYGELQFYPNELMILLESP